MEDLEAYRGAVVSMLAYASFFCLCVHASIVDARVRLVPRGTLGAICALWAIAAAIGAATGSCPFLYAYGDGRALPWIAEGIFGGVAAAGIACFGAGLTRVFLKSEGDALGGGDVKMLFVVGMFLGAEGAFVSLGLACVAALAWQASRGALRMAFRKMKSKRSHPGHLKNYPPGTFPFVPFIAGAVLLYAVAWMTEHCL